MSKYVKKLGSDKSYKRPKTTYQEKLSADEIAEKLQGYEQVDDISEVPLNTHLRYFRTNPDGSQTFRTGGFLHNKKNAETYIMLSNGKSVWSVQIKGTVFFKKMTHKDEIDAIHKLYKKKIAEKDLIISKLKRYIKSKMKTTVAESTPSKITQIPQISQDRTLKTRNNVSSSIRKNRPQSKSGSKTTHKKRN